MKRWMLIVFMVTFFTGVSAQTGTGRVVSADSGVPVRVIRKAERCLRTANDSVAPGRESLEILRRHGFLEARIDSIDSGGQGRAFHLYAGPRYFWGGMGYLAENERLLKAVAPGPGSFEGRAVNFNQWLRYSGKILRHLENNGYPFAIVQLDTVSFDNYRLNAAIRIERNGFFSIDSLITRGNATLSTRFLRRYLNLMPGMPYSEETIMLIDRRLGNLPFLTQVRPATVEFRPSKADVYTYLDRRKANRLNGLLGIVTDDSRNGRIMLVGEADLHLSNSFGGAEQIDLKWRKSGPLIQELKTGLNIPYLFNTPAGIDVQFNLYKKDTSYMNIRGHAGIQVMRKGGNYYNIFYDVTLSSQIRAWQELNGTPLMEEFTTRLYGIGMNRSDLDMAENPRNGYRINVQAGAGIRRLRNVDEKDTLSLRQATRLEMNGSAEVYIPAGQRSVVLLRNHSGYMYAFSKDKGKLEIYENELFRFGGFHSMRGFDEDSYRVSMFTALTLELRYLFQPLSHFYVFIDGAYIRNDQPGKLVENKLVGLGAGMQLNTRAGILSLAYALGKGQSYPFRLQNGKIHIGYVSLF